MSDRGRIRALVRAAWRSAFTPPERLTVSQWADTYRYLSPEYSAAASLGPVPWSTDVVPYARQIMDDLSNPDVREVVLAKSAQVAGSSIGENWLGWITDHQPGPSLIIWPTEKKFRAFALTRLDPMIRDTPRLAEKFPRSGRRSSDDSISLKRFHGGYLQNLTAKSSADLRSFSARNIDCEEIDEWEIDLASQGDPLGMVQARVIAFGQSYKIFYVSTPSIAGHSRIWRLLQGSTDARYHVPCPLCNAEQPLRWKTGGDVDLNCFVWDVDSVGAPVLGSARYRCQACEGLIDFAWRDRMVAAGTWRDTFPGRAVRGYHIWSAYNHFVTWDRLVAMGYDATADARLAKTFANLWLGIPHRSEAQEINPESLSLRAETMPATEDGELVAPAAVGLLTAFVDVQINRLELFIEGWGAGKENWKLGWLTLDGDPGLPDVWDELAALLTQPWTHETGHQLRITATAIDANYQKKVVHDFCDRYRTNGVFPTVGKGGRDRQLLTEPARPTGKRARSQWRPVWIIGTDTAKDRVAGMLKKPRGPESIHFSDVLDSAYYEQLTSEELAVAYVNGRPEQVWRPKPGRRNEALDGAVGNLAALERLGSATINALAALVARFGSTPLAGRVATPTAPAVRGSRSAGLAV